MLLSDSEKCRETRSTFRLSIFTKLRPEKNEVSIKIKTDEKRKTPLKGTKNLE